ncbi:DUF2470 domain-containing protein [Streptomyces solicathayae]|uniref:DUF2470 domain-containing protein n=1 Tax=Streptomyces solicathayae TaxID=3081768 RepID=A0ABZ0LM67_9ACTN|nr:DUF2470 domain-containing protein [Streptomyces sp. HUAS YS2]WOX20536.1 DUF2470 domain-containing protein [Streptomyces sp. HUAS YS2]
MSTHAATALPEPTAAERVRTVLARAISLSLTTAAREYDLIGMHSVSSRGLITLHPPADSPLALEAADAPHGGLAALLEFTDVAPAAVRDRVRARATVSGWLAPAEGDGGLRLDIARVTLRTATGTTDVGPDELVLAEPDPLAVEEAALLMHLVDAHEDLLGELVGLAGARLPHGVVRALPYAMDRHAVTLRCEYETGHCDLRLLFPSPALDAAQAGERIRQLLTRPRTCNHQHPTHTHP